MCRRATEPKRIGPHREVTVEGPRGNRSFTCADCHKSVQGDANLLSAQACVRRNVRCLEYVDPYSMPECA